MLRFLAVYALLSTFYLFSFFLTALDLSVFCLLVYLCNVFQVRTLASAGGPDNLVMLDPAKYKSRPCVPEPAGGEGSTAHPKWQIGEQEFEALMRMLDNLVGTTCSPSSRGYLYKLLIVLLGKVVLFV